VVINVLCFFYEVSRGPALERFLLTYGFVPVRYLYFSEAEPWNLPGRFGPMLASMFLHGGWLHLISNMWVLWIFGDNVEDRLGTRRYLLFYLICGMAAAYAQYWFAPLSGIPMIGASGAIAGVMGAYFVLFPRARVVTLLPIFFFVHIVTVPAVFFLGFWFLLQFFNGAFSLAAAHFMHGGVAWWAHVGGFLTGAILVHLFRRRRPHPSAIRPL
jgi:membrane associated rhomboid family serine protease